MRSRIRRVKRTARKSNGGALSIKPQYRSKLSNRGKKKKMKGGAKFSGESDTSLSRFSIENFFTDTNSSRVGQPDIVRYYYVKVTSVRSNKMGRWDGFAPQEPVTKARDSYRNLRYRGPHDSRTYYPAIMYELLERRDSEPSPYAPHLDPGFQNKISSIFTNTPWSEIVNNEAILPIARKRGHSFPLNRYRGESHQIINERLENIFEAIMKNTGKDVFGAKVNSLHKTTCLDSLARAELEG